MKLIAKDIVIKENNWQKKMEALLRIGMAFVWGIILDIFHGFRISAFEIIIFCIS